MTESTTTIRAVIWDMGGVLLRTADRAPRQELAARFGLSYEQIDQAVFAAPSAQQATLGLISEEAHWQAVGHSFHLTGEALREFRRQFWAGDAMDFDLVNFIRGLRPAFKTALLSNAWPGMRQSVDAKYGVMEAFDVQIISAEVGLAKPDPRIFELTVDRLGVKPAEAVFVDDFVKNVEAAQAAGLYAVRFETSQQARRDVCRLIGREC